MSNRVAIIDYGLCNLDSVARAAQECGASPLITDDPRELHSADRLILPGVGAFRDAMASLSERGLVTPIQDEVAAGAPMLGICLGMQLLATTGDEGGGSDGIGVIDGHVSRLTPTASEPRIPHVGWNEVHPVGESPLFDGIPVGADFYFVHSYHFRPAGGAAVLAETPYAGGFVSAVGHATVFGVQFHPEKSQRYGLQLLANFLSF